MMKRFIFFFSIILIYSCQPEPLALVEVNDLFGALPETVISPTENPTTSEKIELGRLLFYDPILSGNKDVACASCHHPNNAYAEKLDLSIGVGGRGLSSARTSGTLVKRNSMTILNTAYNGIDVDLFYEPSTAVMFWDNRNTSLEKQALEPIHSFEEMRGHAFSENVAMDSIIARLESIAEYQQLFESAFGSNEITDENIAKAIAAFERNLINPNTRFDDYARGDENALSEKEIKGLAAFVEAGCNNCHSGPMFSDYELHALGVPHNEKLNSIDDGNGSHQFRTASLRNLTQTSPYMHNGIFENLEDAIEFYDDFDDSSLTELERDEELEKVDLQERHIDEIAAFLKTLSSDDFDKKIPERVPSNLKVGGEIN